MNFKNITASVEQYYSQKIKTHGISPQGVDWNSQESQFLRFDQLLKICNHHSQFSINDFGCGYGALAEYLINQNYSFQYYGYDISDLMLNQARNKFGIVNNHISFTDQISKVPVSDYTVASGIFNVKQDTRTSDWESYLLATLEDISNLSRLGFAFNILTKYSDEEKMRPDLYYGDPCFLFDYCRTNFSRNVAILHDYDLYEFTVIVRT
ncbi:MAG TPA: SAM-dependent methyltransferase [Planctomycetaceae bacterium]|nr:SAM-dependent methyltransferase [Planctomycetaceae bacterium]|tara:strand:+ start:29943 stop:30569 length:627 start_codon:yes stop_codon:yes gene_type:complete